MLHDNDLPSALAQLIVECRAERAAYANHKNTEELSPACVEVFRRALAGDLDAWEPLMETFKSQLLQWATTDQHLDRDEIIQAAWVAFAKAAPKSTTLVASNQLGPVLAYLRKCIKTATITLLRQERRLTSRDAYAIPSNDHGDDAIAFSLSVRTALQESMRTFSDEERLVFFLRFELGMTSQQIADAHPQHFNTANAVYLITQRVLRRLKKDQHLRDLYDYEGAPRQSHDQSTSLAMTLLTSSDQKGNAMPSSCTLGEELLLDYILGHASAEVQIAIESSPSCRAAAIELSALITPLIPIVYRLECPDPLRLVDYQEGVLSGVEHLILHNHLRRCPLCAQEITLLETMDRIDTPTLPERSSWLSRVATRRSAVAFGLRGSRQEYDLDGYSMFLMVREAPSLELAWDLRGEIYAQGQSLSRIRTIQLVAISSYEPHVYESPIDAEGGFRFGNLAEGIYTMLLQTDGSVLTVPDIRIGVE